MRRRIAHHAQNYAVALSVGASFLLLALAGVYSFRQQMLVNERLCQQTVANRAATRGTWLAAQRYILQGAQTSESADRTREFFQAVLKEIPSLKCVDQKPMEVES